MNIDKILTECSDLLNESAGRNGLAKRIYEEKFGKMSNKERGDMLKEAKERGATMSKMIDNAKTRKDERNIDKFEKETSKRYSRAEDLDIMERDSKDMLNAGKSTLHKDAANTRDSRKRLKYVDKQMNKYMKNDAKSSSKINSSINNRAASQNECTNNELAAKCLIEAAELLTEGIFGFGKKGNNSAEIKTINNRIASLQKQAQDCWNKHNQLKQIGQHSQAEEWYSKYESLNDRIDDEKKKLEAAKRK